MSVETIIVCDNCGAHLADASPAHALVVTGYVAEQIVARHFGMQESECTCGAQILEFIEGLSKPVTANESETPPAPAESINDLVDRVAVVDTSQNADTLTSLASAAGLQS